MTSRMAFAGPGPQLGVHKSGYQAECSTRVQGEGDLKQGFSSKNFWPMLELGVQLLARDGAGGGDGTSRDNTASDRQLMRGGKEYTPQWPDSQSLDPCISAGNFLPAST